MIEGGYGLRCIYIVNENRAIVRKSWSHRAVSAASPRKPINRTEPVRLTCRGRAKMARLFLRSWCSLKHYALKGYNVTFLLILSIAITLKTKGAGGEIGQRKTNGLLNICAIVRVLRGNLATAARGLRAYIVWLLSK